MPLRLTPQLSGDALFGSRRHRASLVCLTAQLGGGALFYVPWHVVSHRPLQLLVMRRAGQARI